MVLCSRETAIRLIFSGVTNEAIVTSTGMISREVYKLFDRPLNFYMQGSMGMALAIGLGIARQRPKLGVKVISGDGSCLMSLGTLSLHKKLAAAGMTNLTHYILDNNCHASTGGQPTCSDYVDFNKIGPVKYTVHIPITSERGDAPRIALSCKQIKERFKHAITNSSQ